MPHRKVPNTARGSVPRQLAKNHPGTPQGAAADSKYQPQRYKSRAEGRDEHSECQQTQTGDAAVTSSPATQHQEIYEATKTHHGGVPRPVPPSQLPGTGQPQLSAPRGSQPSPTLPRGAQTCQVPCPKGPGQAQSRARLIPVQAPPAIWPSPCLSPAASVQSHQRREDTNCPGAPRAPPAPSPSCPRR